MAATNNHLMNAETQAELNAIIRDLQNSGKNVKRGANAVLKAAAEPLRAAIARRAPVSAAPHSRYNTSKISKAIRAPKGSGQPVATYTPGNLKQSFQILPLRRVKFAKIIGPVVSKGEGAKMPDGYYAHMVEFDTRNVDGSVRPGKHFVQAGVQAAGGIAVRLAVEGFKGTLKKYAKQTKTLSWGERYEAAKAR